MPLMFKIIGTRAANHWEAAHRETAHQLWCDSSLHVRLAECLPRWRGSPTETAEGGTVVITFMVTAPATVEATTFFGPMAASPKGREQIPNPVMTPESDLKICDG